MPASRTDVELRDRVLESVASVQDAYIAGRSPGEVFQGLLDHVIELTDSDYGYIGEVLEDEDGTFLKAYAMTDIAWDEASRQIYDQAMEGGGFEFRNLRSLFGEVLTTGEPVIANDAPNDPRASGTMRGHLPLDRFLGLPLYSEGELVGSVGVSNRPGGYDEDLVAALRPFLSTCGNLVRAFRERRLRDAAEDRATSSRARLATVVEAAEEGILTIDEDGAIETANAAALGFLGSDAIGTSLLDHVLEEDAELAARRLADPVGGAERVRVRRPDGAVLLTDTSVSVAETPEGRVRVVVVRDATRQARVEDALRAARDEALRHDRAKNDFLAAMSHELRTPLNGVLGLADLLRTEQAGPLGQQQAEWVDLIHRSGSHLLSLINDVLDLAKIEADRFELGSEPVDLAAVIAEAVSMVAATAEVAGREVEVDVADDLPTVQGDARRLRQVVLNLLSNAAKFTDPDDAFGVVARRGGLGVRVEVWDDGPGIAADARERIFEPFEQADNGLTRSRPGTGLGLPLSARLVAAHGGELSLESSEGAGSRFVVDLPAAGG